MIHILYFVILLFIDTYRSTASKELGSCGWSQDGKTEICTLQYEYEWSQEMKHHRCDYYTMTHIHKTICKIPFQKFTAWVWEKQTIFLIHFEFMKNMFEVQTGADNDIYMWSVPICFV